MHEKRDRQVAVALLLITWAMNRAFERTMGMTLDEWDELNYQRIAASDERPGS